MLELTNTQPVPSCTEEADHSLVRSTSGALSDNENEWSEGHIHLRTPPAAETRSVSADQEEAEGVRFGPDKKRNWFGGSSSKDSFPYYLTPRSKATLSQRALLRMQAPGKQAFDRYFAEVMAKRGLKSGHTGACIIFPGEWAALDPRVLAEKFDSTKVPLAGSMKRAVSR